MSTPYVREKYKCFPTNETVVPHLSCCTLYAVFVASLFKHFGRRSFTRRRCNIYIKMDRIFKKRRITNNLVLPEVIDLLLTNKSNGIMLLMALSAQVGAVLQRKYLRCLFTQSLKPPHLYKAP